MLPERSEFAVIEVPDRLLESVRRFWGPTIIEEETTGKQARVRFAFRPEGFDYVARWLLSLGTDAEILSPEALRVKVAGLALATAEHHQLKKSSRAKTPLT